MAENRQQEVNVHMSAEVRGGVYSNNMVVQHTLEEFVLDFLMVVPPEGTVNARIIISPEHAKRIHKALGDNIERYEDAYGPIKSADAPKTFI